MGTNTTVDITEIEKAFGSFRLGPLTVKIQPGFITAVVGPNGSGKSTLFRLLLNELHADKGELRIFDQRYPHNEVEIKQNIGYMADQAEEFDLNAKVCDKAEFVAHWYPNWNEALYQQLMEKYHIDSNKKLKHLSKGMLQKFEFVLALAHEPDLLMLDEPSSGLDPFAWRMMMDEITQYMERGDKTVIIATHILEEIKRLADYILFIYEGEYIGLYEKDELLDSWKCFWVETKPDGALAIPGVIDTQEDQIVQLVSHQPHETEKALKQRDIPIVRTKALELDEILLQLVRMNRE